jgi:hypothetical protein
MTIYVDEPRYYRKFSGYAECCHLWTDGPIEDLHAFARRIGLKRQWFQADNPRFLHYDLLGSTKRQQALDAGAQVVSLRTWIGASKLALSEKDEGA